MNVQSDNRVTLKLLVLICVLMTLWSCSELDEAEDTCDYEGCTGNGSELVGTWVKKDCVELEQTENRNEARGNFARTELIFTSTGGMFQNRLRYEGEACDTGLLAVDPSGIAFSYTTGDIKLDESGLLAVELDVVFNNIGVDSGEVNGHYFISEASGLCLSDQYTFGPEETNLNSGALSGELKLTDTDCFERQ